jgi:hypothetical protein
MFLLGIYNVQSRDEDENKLAVACILGPITSTKMVMEFGRELSWQDVPLCWLEHYRAADTS